MFHCLRWAKMWAAVCEGRGGGQRLMSRALRAASAASLPTCLASVLHWTGVSQLDAHKCHFGSTLGPVGPPAASPASQMSSTNASLFDVHTLPGYTPLELALDSAPRGRGLTAGTLFTGPPGKPPRRQQPRTAAATAQGGDDASWVRTDEDVVTYFETYGEKAQTQYFFCLAATALVAGPADDHRRDSESGDVTHDAAVGSPASGEFFLRVVSPQKVANAPLYFIISPRQVVRVEAQRSGGGGRQTETLPLSLWLAHKRAFLSLRRLTFFQCFSLTKCFARWRTNARLHVLRRRRRVLQSTLLPACPAFSEALLGVQAALYGRLRAVRTAAVQPGRRYTAVEWADEQAAWRTHRAQPEVQEVLTELVRMAEAAVQRVEAEAAELERTVQPAELTDRIGVDLYAATSKARARSMQQIKQDKIDRAAAYHRALAERAHLPRFLRMLDMRLRGALADMAVASVASAVGALRAAAAGLQPAGPSGVIHVASMGREIGLERQSSQTSGSRPVFLCNVVFTEDGSIGFAPSEPELTAAVEAEVLESSLSMAGNVPPLLAVPAFDKYRALLADEQWRQEGLRLQLQQQDRQLGAADLAKQDSVLVRATAELRALLCASFVAARQQAEQYKQYQDIRRFGATFDFEAWAARQREALDLLATEAVLSRLRGWQEQLEGMQLEGAAGLLHVDGTALQAQLAPLVSTAQDKVTGLLLQLAAERCRTVLQELSVWREVVNGRPPELDGFLPWARELAAMQQGVGQRLAAAQQADDALGLVLTYEGRLPTADAVKRDDLKEAAAALPAELEAAAVWQVEQRGVHAAAVERQVELLGEEAILLESEAQVGPFVDPGSPLDEVLADLELMAARVAQLAAQAEDLAAVAQELGVQPGDFLEVREAEVVAKHRAELWRAVADAEMLQARLAGESSTGTVVEKEQGADPPADMSNAVGALQERLAGLRGAGDAPDAIWLRANTALYACRAALGA